LYLDLGVKQFNAKQFAPAVASFQRATALTPNDAQALELLAQGQAASGQNAEAAATFQRALQARTAAGQKPDENIYRRAVQAAYDAKTPGAVDLARQWLAAYPSADAWQNAIAVYLSTAHPDSSLAFDLLRLKNAAAVMHGSGDYFNYASAAIEEANYGEAKAVVSEGLASGKITASDSMIQQVQAALKGKATPTAAELATAEQTAKVPTAFLRVGDRYYGAGNYQKAADLYRQALAKGADANLANLRLGEALARAGDKAGAVAAFNKVGGSYADIAKFWLVYAQRQA
jgi:tetratricopeptide (TPR) repeat protein